MQSLALTCILVREYDEAIAFYVGVLGFNLIEDSPVPAQSKRWVVVAPPGAGNSGLLLAQGENSLDDAADPVWAGRNKRSIQDAAGARPQLDSGKIEVQILANLWVSLKSTASARAISASDNWKARLDSAP